MIAKLSKESKILIASFSVWKNGGRTPLDGNIRALLEFFSPKVFRIDLIDGRHPGSDKVTSFIEIHQKEQLKKSFSSKTSLLLFPFLKSTNFDKTQIFFKIRDFLSTLEVGIFSRQKYQLFIGLESIYALAGIILKKLGIVETVVYYISDYAPNRYPQKWFNSIYLRLDRFCAMHADFIWDVSKAMHPARIKAGLNPKKSAPELHVPNALFPNQIKYLPLKSIKEYHLVYAGTLGIENGPDLLIKALPLVKKKVARVKLHIYGGNKIEENELKKLTKKLGLEKIVFFHGFIADVDKLSKFIRQFYIGLAPYRTIPLSIRWYADATKLRLYLAAGLPIITTQVPPLGKELVGIGAGVVVKDNEKDLAKAIVKMLKNKKLYQKTRRAAIKYIKNNTWENVFTKALQQMGML